MKITGAEVFCSDKRFRNKDIYIKDDRFVNESSDNEKVDARGCLAIPGLIDIHFHGALGYDVCDGTYEAYEKIAGYELQNGITSICPATLTLAVDELKNVLSMGKRIADEKRQDIAELLGFNMEGPFISRAKKGAQNEEFIIRCNAGIVDEFLEASGGLLKIIGLAPEENPGFEDYIHKVKDKVKISLAHTACDYSEAVRAFEAGASHIVHLYNAMNGMNHRQPGLVGAAADTDFVSAELICDGIHIHPAVVRNTFKMFGPERIIMISDSMRATGMPDASYDLGGQEVIKRGRLCTLSEGGSIAGSASNLMECLLCAVKEMKIPLETVVAATTINPARAIGADKSFGSIEDGKIADLVLLDSEDMSLKGVFKRGKRVL